MKKYLCAFIFLFALTKAGAQTQPGSQVSSHIAQRMKDTLFLTLAQQQEIFAVNMKLHNEKMAVRQQFTQPDSLRHYFQRVENQRDSLYKKIISPDQFILYRVKKENIFSY